MVIELGHLTKFYGRQRGIVDVTLAIGAGEVFGFLGPNGAGKTTTMRVLLDFLRPSSGTARVLGLDCHRDRAALHRRIGYLAGDLALHERLTAIDHLTWLAGLQGGVPRDRIEQLAADIDLELGRPIRDLSKGNRQKVGLVQAFLHDPEVLVLDEPTSGLDPLVQHTVHRWLREAAGEGRTVFLSSHVLDEVDRTCDRVGIIREGRLVAVEAIDDLRQRSLRQVTIRFAHAPPLPALARVPGVLDLAAEGNTVRLRLGGAVDPLVKVLAGHEVLDLVSVPADLDAIFRAFYEGHADG